MPVPRTKTAVQALLGAHGLHPKRLKGQNFLVDPNLIDFIVRTSGVGPGDRVLEVGTGTGILTDALAATGADVVTCDVDASLQRITRGLQEWPDRVRFVEADVLRSKHVLNPDVIEAWQSGLGRRRLVSNLPYSVATPLIATLLWEGIEFEDGLVLVQREAAERFIAPVNTAEYGAMTVAVRLLAEASIVRHVGPQVFWPQPKVQSALLALRPVDTARARELNAAGLQVLLRNVFTQRRKTLRKRFSAEQLEAAGIDPGARPQEVEPEAWAGLLTVRPS
ncbi:MAG: 16S rRNA (adenine(1518)-N(6)/adenine(1519)-N(6))-dimethyltransferase RsmA [Planctomycetota bacterium]|jgi:16S rRNA (adenine1518-N6/adenine1519-N6)-dimethyltransferase